MDWGKLFGVNDKVCSGMRRALKDPLLKKWGDDHHFIFCKSRMGMGVGVDIYRCKVCGLYIAVAGFSERIHLTDSDGYTIFPYICVYPGSSGWASCNEVMIRAIIE